ncbi:MAG: ABC transporter ATP-binding protein [Acutalibacteraceae bacterium]|nr:ABC transporter ATP-binding protein [Acutalibacteraceae bacterium]
MIKKLLSCVREYKLPSILSPLTVSMEVLIEVLIPYLMADLIDYGINKGDMPYILKMGLFLFLCALVSLMFGVLSGRFAAKASAGFAKNLRHDMFHAVQDFSFSNIDKFSTASIITRLTTDVTQVQNAYQMIIRIAVRSPLMFAMSLIMALRVNAKVSMVFLIAVPILIGTLGFIMIKVHKIFERMFKTYDELNNTVQENLHGIRVVKAFVREDYEQKKFKGVSKLIYKLSTDAERILAFNSPIMQFCVYGCMLLISWIGANLIQQSLMTTGELMSLVQYTMQILNSLMMFSMFFVMIVMSQASIKRIVEVLDEKSDLVNPKNPIMQVNDGSIEFSNVSFSYKKGSDAYSLKDIDLKIESGQTIGIIGGTGSSKSTLVQLIPRLYDVSKGTLKVGGIDVRDYDIETLRSEVAMVLQKNVLFSGTINDNIRWGNENATDEQIKHVCELACADEFIEKFPDKYETYIEQVGTNVSGGQKQRLCIARALLKKPKILILDDSTSAVDTATDAKIRKAFREEIPDTTKLIIAQRISSVQESDKIIVLDEGKVVAFGSHDELMKTSNIYKEVYNTQMKGSE